LLGGLALVAIANGVLLGLSLYGMFAVAVKLVHGRVPSLAYAWLFGIATGITLLVRALMRERQLREREYSSWSGPVGEISNRMLSVGLNSLVDASSLDRAPTLSIVESWEPNAFTVGKSRSDASIVVTSGLLELLTEEEIDAVIAHEVAEVETDSLKAVGLADAIADSVKDLGRTKSRYFWGPKRIALNLRPLLVVYVIGALIIAVQPRTEGDAGATLLIGVLALGLTFAFFRAFIKSWRGQAQLILLTAFFGPLSLVEMALATPTTVLLSKLVSRSRIFEADHRSTQLTCNPQALISALEKLADSDASPDERLGYLRFSLFVSPPPRPGYRAWLSRFRRTHPSIPDRIESITQLAQDDDRPRAPVAEAAHRLEQSG
jgi:Zn-dependent protease with chaperone function